MANRLAAESSPYLRQHADNPVDWYPWGEAAFERARAEDKPILLSVGYSSCHWCHVMAHESFEDPAIADLMNRWFVNVKVDREERPDVDAVYMTATQALTGQGGWPMTVFLTPDLEPFYAGTYFPPRDGHGRPGFPRLLEALHEAWSNDRANVLASSEQITAHLKGMERAAAGDRLRIDSDAAARAAGLFERTFDRQWGGFGGAPKFPSPSNLDFLLAHHVRTGSQPAFDMVLGTLKGMASGGIYDHLAGGFARYSVDAKWLVPHFEKMLYDNAQLARTYLHGWQLTGIPALRQVTEETLDYLLREMRHPLGGFYSATDADSEGIEGKYFVWTPAEVEAVLGADEARLFCAAYGVTAEGNFQDPHHPEFGRRSVLYYPQGFDAVATAFGLEREVVERRLSLSREVLLAERGTRVPPGLDYKLQTSWNGLALAALADAGRVLGRPDYVEAAIANAAFVQRELWRRDERRLLHVWTEGVASVDGMLEDYAWYGLGLVELYKATGDLTWLACAAGMLEIVLERFHDGDKGGFFATPVDAERLLFREKPVFDGPTPSGNASLGQLAWWLGRYYDRDDWLQVADECLRVAQDAMAGMPNGFGASWLLAELLLATPRELAIVGEPAARRPFEAVAAGRFVPALVLAPAAEPGGLPLLEGKAPIGAATAWLCESFACQLPATTPEQLESQLAAI